jgi:hypothetical protein
MTDEHQANSDTDHWNDLARQLGLDAEPSAHEPPPSPQPHTRRAVHEEPAATESARPASKEDIDAGSVRAQRAGPQPTESGAKEEPPADEAPRRRGGRGRSSRRGSRSREEGEPRQAPADSAEPTPEEKESSKEERKEGRRRGRGRRRRDSEAEETEAPPAQAGAAEEEDDRLEEVDTLSDWSVPSWNELIASLYRPER